MKRLVSFVNDYFQRTGGYHQTPAPAFVSHRFLQRYEDLSLLRFSFFRKSQSFRYCNLYQILRVALEWTDFVVVRIITTYKILFQQSFGLYSLWRTLSSFSFFVFYMYRIIDNFFSATPAYEWCCLFRRRCLDRIYTIFEFWNEFSQPSSYTWMTDFVVVTKKEKIFFSDIIIWWL
jgi:hypothetical protein